MSPITPAEPEPNRYTVKGLSFFHTVNWPRSVDGTKRDERLEADAA